MATFGWKYLFARVLSELQLTILLCGECFFGIVNSSVKNALYVVC